MKAGPLGALLLLGLIWGASYLFIKIGVADLTPAHLVTLRLLIAAVTLIIPLQLRGPGLPRGFGLWRDLAVMGLLGSALPFLLITWGETSVSSGIAAVLNATTPFFTTIMAFWLIPEEILSARGVAGVVVGFVGAAVLVSPDLGALSSADLTGQLAIIAASASYAGAAIWARLRLKGEPLALAGGQVICGLCWMIPVVLLFARTPPTGLTWPAALSVLELGVLGTGVAYIIYFWLIARVGAIRTTLVTYIIPVAGLILGAVFLAEQIHWTALIGMALIALGISTVQNVGPDRWLRALRPGKEPAAPKVKVG